MSFALIVYILSAATALFCFVMLVRGYLRTRVRLIFWTSWCFAGLSLNALLVIVDHFTPDRDLSAIRALPALIGALALVYGLIRENT